MSKSLKFSEAFQQIHGDSEQVITLHINRLDRISNDIKVLEKVLVEAAIPFKFNYDLKTESYELINKNVFTNYQLKWDKKRLVYAEYKGDDAWGSDMFSRDNDKNTPLIETKSQVRLSVENELPIFFKMIIGELEKDPLRESVDVKSPNYQFNHHRLPV